VRKLLLVILFFNLPGVVFAEVEIIEVKHRAASDIVSQLRVILDDGEKAEAAGSHIILIADGESLQAAVKMIALLDTAQRNLVIRIRQSEERQRVGKDVSAAVRYSTHAAGTVAVESGYRLGNSSTSQEQSLQLIEGGRGLIEIGHEIPYTQEWAAVTGDTTGYSESTAYQTVATGFWIYPKKLVGDKVLVDVEPYVGNAKKNGSAAPQIDFAQLRTRLQVPVGQWYPLGSQLMHRDKVSRAIISWRSSNRQADRQFEIRIDTVD